MNDLRFNAVDLYAAVTARVESSLHTVPKSTRSFQCRTQSHGHRNI